MITSVGIVGYGSFGKLLADLLAPYAEVKVYSRRNIPSDQMVSNVSLQPIEVVAGCPLVIVANDLASLEEACRKIAPYVSAETIVMDVCSVKVAPVKILRQVFGKRCRLLATHPLWGPQAVAANGGTEGLKMAWHELQGGPFDGVRQLFEGALKLSILPMLPEDHDKEMAWVHGLTFFVGRGLLQLNPPESGLATHYYNELMDVVGVEKTHSYDLFMTIQQGNPYTDDIRRQFVEILGKLEATIMEKDV